MLQYEAKKGKKVGAKWITAGSNRSSWSVCPAGGIIWSSETMWGTGNTVFYSEWDKTLIYWSDRMKQRTIKLDTKNVLFCTCIFVYLLSLLSTCVLIMWMSCVWKCVVIIVWVTCWYLQYCITCRPTNWLISFLNQHFHSCTVANLWLTLGMRKHLKAL